MRLTEHFIRSKTRIENMQAIRQFNCCGCDLEDITPLSECGSLEQLSLAVNRISTLQPLSSLSNLREVSVRNNHLSGLSTQLRFLHRHPHLRSLWLKDNPLADEPNYRRTVAWYLPQLQVLDGIPLSQEEKTSPVKQEEEEVEDNQMYFSPEPERRKPVMRVQEHQVKERDGSVHEVNAILRLLPMLSIPDLHIIREAADIQLRRALSK